MATAHGIYLKADVDTGKFPLYFLKIFDPDLTESSADFEEHFKVDSREQFIHYLEVASLTAGLKPPRSKSGTKPCFRPGHNKSFSTPLPLSGKGSMSSVKTTAKSSKFR